MNGIFMKVILFTAIIAIVALGLLYLVRITLPARDLRRQIKFSSIKAEITILEQNLEDYMGSLRELEKTPPL